MVRYRRNFVPCGTYFFTATLKDRRSRILVEKIDCLRHALRVVRRERPFVVDAIVVLPDHLHTIISLPDDDADFSGRWKRAKSIFSRLVAPTLASRVRDWPHSSFHRYVRLGWLSSDWGGVLGEIHGRYGEP